MIVSIDEAVFILKNSGIIAFPTETVYGLGGVATNSIAIKKIYEAKNRPADNPLICHFANLKQVQEYLVLDKLVISLIKQFSPGPISFLLNLPTNSSLKPSVAGQPFVAIRIPSHPIALELLTKLDLPLAAPSANISTRPSGTNAEMVLSQFRSKIDGVIDGGNCQVGLESTILDCTNLPYLKILRPGIIGEKEITNFLNSQSLKLKVEQNSKTKTIVPGNKYRHYSCQTQIEDIAIENIEKLKSGNLVILAINSDIKLISRGWKLLEKQEKLHKFQKQNSIIIKVINLGQNLEEVGQDLYQNISKIDTLNVNKAYIIIPQFDNSSLTLTLKNRLNKILSTNLN